MYVFGLADKILNNKDDAEDVVIDVFTSLWIRINDVPVNKAKAFISVTANNKCLDIIKYRRIHPIGNYSEYVEYEEMALIESQVLKAILRIIETKLTKREKEIFKMSYLEDLKSRKIAEILNLNVITVCNILSAARKKIRINFEYPAIFLLIENALRLFF